MWRLLRWLAEKRGDMVWNALVIVTVMLPLMSLTVDIPRYFILRSTLQNAADAAAEAAAQTLDAAALIIAAEAAVKAAIGEIPRDQAVAAYHAALARIDALSVVSHLQEELITPHRIYIPLYANP